MRTSAFEPPDVPPAFWEHPDVARALAERDMGSLFRLLKEHAGISHMRVGTAAEIGPGRMSNVVNGKGRIKETQVFERIANGLNMPDAARLRLGLSLQQNPSSGSPAKEPRPGQHTELLYRIAAHVTSTPKSSPLSGARPTPSGCSTGVWVHRPFQPNSRPTSTT